MRHPYADFIHQVAKPARYLGGEHLAVVKPAGSVQASIALAFPDVYEIGMSHMGTKILYSLLNKDERIAAERAFTPWVDMEAELRARKLPLVSLETGTPLAEFDVIGISLQYELTYTNVLTLLDLGGVPLYAAERDNEAPLVLGGGPVATHPEPMAPFFDAFFIGEAEEELPDLLLAWASMRRAGHRRCDALADLAARFPLYVPSLYRTEVERSTGMVVVGEPLDPRVPRRVRRGFVADLAGYPFPGDTPVPYAEAVFDRAGVEIARGCTEGCRFCQAGMIYRPVRERSPDSIVSSILAGVEKAGYDETSLTSLSTADYSCITPLVKEVMLRLRHKKVSLSVSSLRAYGLDPEILDEMAASRATGLTFAPEAGTQRMRDVVNKNVTEAHVIESSHRVFSRGWHRLKLYFMIGLPTEQDEDVIGVVETGERTLEIGRQYAGKRAEVTVSVSSHVPKPHTPFQWCAQDAEAEIQRKQELLRATVRQRQLRLKYHDRGISLVEGVLARGDRRLAASIALAWRRGARFDGWDELFDVDRWQRAFVDTGIAVDDYLATRPVQARLPWDHIDVGLEDGFLLREYRKALSGRLSPPCGKVRGQLIHHKSLESALAERGKLVCYDCGVACDLSRMREERLIHLRALGATSPLVPAAKVSPPPVVSLGAKRRSRPIPRAALTEPPAARRFRVQYAKIARAAYLGHLDLGRVFARLFRRAGLEVAYSRGFHPQPLITFAPALSLGVPALAELLDIQLETDLDAADLTQRLRESSPPGIEFRAVRALGPNDVKLSKLIRSYDLALAPPVAESPAGEAELLQLARTFLAAPRVAVRRDDREIDVRELVEDVDVLAGEAAMALTTALEWKRAPALLRARVAVRPDGSARPREVASALFGVPSDPFAAPRLCRLGFAGCSETADSHVSTASSSLTTGPAPP
jgi:radical SAM family uncharacterized protein/radical SAM-linked protein